MKRLAPAWDAYRAEVIPKGAGPVQLEETRRAFFGGAAILFGLLTNGVSAGTSEPTRDDLSLMSDLDAEIREFFANMLRQT